ncbi:helix-turn-helix domain-containing protein (plasmid) [Aneurinibacillus thermoaerophilus]|uniref:Helix-turn-helix domain-containing protein n=1 Tax=Aneurinibacillus thermoaerophilus TaxID=143495 RepID=A0ABX8YIB5_ANETH|nr:helix-turn-helix domain-containing protein [Aneurinibacillus thermoaerophilus]QYY44803.1 helix-turn-helix domain-containing protein [Aneurinibacillus thermoaerophilus]
MSYNFDTKEQLKKFIADEVLNSAEAIEYLGISRARLSQLIKDEKLIPIKKLQRDSLFLKSDLEEKKKEMEKLRKKYRPFDHM